MTISDQPLLSAEKRQPIQETAQWRFVHGASFLEGGLTFIMGTVLYYGPDSDLLYNLSALFYTIGSLGFLTVDVMEFFTFTESKSLRLNISMSALGSFLYVIGSIGYFPSLLAVNELIGVLGFILGSFFIGVSQMWKCYRILTTSEEKRSKETLTQLGVEGGACLGAWCFFVGTFIYWYGVQSGPLFKELVVTIWTFGSLFFTTGGVFLCYRHGVMGV